VPSVAPVPHTRPTVVLWNAGRPVLPSPVFNGGGDGATQDYWYCWDEGDPSPHHLGYPVSGDHLCTDEELDASGCTQDDNGDWSC
jgi:hypothetical protein